MDETKNALLNELFNEKEREELCRKLMIQIQNDLFDFLASSWGFDMSDLELREMIENDEEFLRITKNVMKNAVYRCNYEKMIILTLVEMKRELNHFSINLIPINQGNENVKS